VTRDLSTSAQTALAATTRRVFDLVSIKQQDNSNLFIIGTDSTVIDLLFTNCDVDLTYNSEIFQSNSGYLGHSEITETTNAANDKVSVTFDGVDLTNARDILNANFVGCRVNIKKVIVNADYTFSTDNVYEVFDGFINTFNLTTNKKTANFRLECGGPFSAFEKATIYGYATTLSHQTVFTDDKGFEFAQQTLTDLQWGKA
jgi:uncharacterized protein YjbI with pentapeptide repeats